MNEEDIEKILNQLKNSIKEPVLLGEDYYTGEGWEEPNFFCLDPTTKDCKTLFEYIERLEQENKKIKDNWNKLKEWLEEEIKYNENWYKPECKEYIGQKRYPDDTIDGFNYVLDKLQEIEGGMNE